MSELSCVASSLNCQTSELCSIPPWYSSETAKTGACAPRRSVQLHKNRSKVVHSQQLPSLGAVEGYPTPYRVTKMLFILPALAVFSAQIHL